MYLGHNQWHMHTHTHRERNLWEIHINNSGFNNYIIPILPSIHLIVFLFDVDINIEIKILIHTFLKSSLYVSLVSMNHLTFYIRWADFTSPD